ncbi:helix-turn-helix domain-containing protein [Nocardiopsis sp. YSL2]|uniref:helix-turn-helix domain-containing protein n=1 Tax=Nocardiopsis sp. YSL2 TaxID=2939492 RepID=UPI0026F4556C|nr:helix-turn-helix domain-containing protein [Nocardiopsis sp. YSL2]
MSLPAVYTPAQAAEILQCRESWLKDKAKARAIPFHKLSGEYRFTDEDLAEIIRITAERPEAEPSPPARATGPRTKRPTAATTPPTAPEATPLRPRRRLTIPAAG